MADAVLGLRPRPPFPTHQIATVLVVDANAATTTIPCLAIARLKAATTDGDSREPLADANAIAEGYAEMETLSSNTDALIRLSIERRRSDVP